VARQTSLPASASLPSTQATAALERLAGRAASDRARLTLVLLIALCQGILYLCLQPPWQHYDEPTHFDLYRVSADQTIKIGVPVHFANQDTSPGLKRGGTLNVVFHDVLVSCHANQIPEELIVDLGALDIGDSVHISDLTFPKGVEPAIDVDTVIVTISGASSQAGEDEAADAATGEAAAAESAAEAEAEADKGGEE